MEYWPADYIIYRVARGHRGRKDRRPAGVRTPWGWLVLGAFLTLLWLPLAFLFWSAWFLELVPCVGLVTTWVFVTVGVVESLRKRRRS